MVAVDNGGVYVEDNPYPEIGYSFSAGMITDSIRFAADVIANVNPVDGVDGVAARKEKGALSNIQNMDRDMIRLCEVNREVGGAFPSSRPAG